MVLDVDVQSHPLSLHVEVGAFRIWLESARNMALALALSLSLSRSLSAPSLCLNASGCGTASSGQQKMTKWPPAKLFEQ